MVETAVKLDNVSFKYRNSDSFALRRISLEVAEGEFILLAGFSGSGKSTLLKCLNGLIPHFHAGSFGGNVEIFGKSTLESETTQLAKQVGFVFQNPENQISNLTVEREIAFPLENFGVPKNEIISRVDELIALFNLEEIKYKSPYSISGGEQQLTAIASALALNPPILVLDEVTAHLSPQSAVKILNLLNELNTKHKKTIIIAEHRLDRCLHFANKLAFLEKGQLKVFGDVRTVFQSKEFPKNMLPKIPSIFLKLDKEIGLLGERASELPLTVEELVATIK
ncbi:MAG: energy-coupling factor ABC transporter ATP-binding protein [Candidatus Heimdallarchaeota archaeon]